MIPFTFELRLDGIAGMRKRDVNNCKKAAFRAVGDYWLEKLLPKHFGPQASFRYGYARRRSGYRRKDGTFVTYDQTKERRVGHKRKLEYTGTFKRQVLSPTRQRVRPSFKGVRVTLRHDARRKEQNEEVTRVTAADLKELSEVFVKAFDAEVARFRGTRVIR